MKKILFSVLTATLVFIFVSSCEKNNLNKENLSFLDINIVENRIFSDSEFKILTEAYKRVEKFIEYDNGRYNVSINSSSEINISERLFLYMRETIEMTNKQEEFYRILSKQGIKFVKPKHFQIKSFPRVRSGGESEGGGESEVGEGGYSIYHGIGYVVESVTLSHDESIFLLNSLQSSAGDVGQFINLLGFGTGIFNPYSSAMCFILGSCAYLQSNSFSNMENQYIQSGSSSGITFSTYTSYLNDGSIPVTQYFSNINQDE